MLEINTIRFDKERVLNGLNKRNVTNQQLELIDSIVELDDIRKKVQTENDIVLSEINRLSKEIGDLFKSGRQGEANDMKNQVAVLKEKAKSLDEEAKRNQQELTEMIIQLPNVPHDSVPAGKSAEDNVVFKDWDGALDDLEEGSIPHWELSDKYNIFNLADGVKLTGAGFPVFKGKGAKLSRALISYFLEQASQAGYLEIAPPLMVNYDSARGTGNLPDKEAQMYYVERDELYLIPTAEVPLTNLYRDCIVPIEELPIQLTGYTPCFRREAGSYGADVKGLNRVHQFDKVEIVQIQHPEKSYESLMGMIDHVSKLLDELKLPYRILRLCGGDMGFTSALTFDFEVYSKAQKRWLEVSSVSNFETFQANRMMLRYKDTDGKNKLAHTLNGSALALPRIVAAILENFQTKEGVIVPEVLRKYTGFDLIN